jgi:protease PrsW
MNYPLYIFFGLAPSVIWLLFFLRKDSHPESNKMILKVFFFGMAAAIPVALLEIGFYEELKPLSVPLWASKLVYAFLGISLIEELFKYLAVKKTVLKNSELDEPVDIMLYMIIAALGFAAAENLLVLLPMLDPFRFLETAMVSLLRFLGATFLHALVSGLLGYFLALSFNGRKNRSKLVWLGLSTAVALHGLYDFSIMEVGGNLKFLIPIAILVSLTVFVSLVFQRVKKIKSICKT